MKALDTLGDLLSRPEGTWSLAEGALAVARIETPDLDARAIHAQLDAIGSAARRRFPAGTHPRFLAPILGTLLEQELGLGPAGGRDEDGVDLWCLDRVLERGAGAPLVLAIIAAEVARRCGRRFAPIALPGVVLLRHDVGDSVMIHAPDSRLALLDRDACCELVFDATGEDYEFREGWLRPLDSSQVLARLLVGLKECYWRASQHERALDAIRLLLAIRPEDPREIRDSGRVLFTLGRFREAIDAFESYLMNNPHGADADAVRMLLVEARRGLAQ